MREYFVFVEIKLSESRRTRHVCLVYGYEGSVPE